MTRMVITVEVAGERLTVNKIMFNMQPKEFPAVADRVWDDMLLALSEKFV